MPVPTPTSRMRPPMRSAAAIEAWRPRSDTVIAPPILTALEPTHRERRQDHAPGPAVGACAWRRTDIASPSPQLRARSPRPPWRPCGDHFGGRRHTLDEAAAEHPRLAPAGVVEHARLAGRDALFAVDQLDLDGTVRGTEPGRLRRPRRAHLDEHVAPAAVSVRAIRNWTIAEPVHVAQPHPHGAQRVARTNDHARPLGVEPHHVERLARRDAEAAALADREVHDAAMTAEHAAGEVDNVAGNRRARQQPLDHIGVAAGRDETDILAVLLVGDRKAEAAREFAHLCLGLVAEWKAHEVELLTRGREQEIALVALLLTGAKERAGAAREPARHHVVPGRERLGAELAGGREQVVELDRLVALDAGDRGLARRIALREAVDHRFLEAALVVEHVVRNTKIARDPAGIVDVAAGATGALAVGCLPMVVELQRDANHVVALGLEQRRGHRRIDAARHGDNDAGVLRRTLEIETVGHRHQRPGKPRSLAEMTIRT